VAVASVCAALLLAIGLVFGQTVRHDFVNYDDPAYVSENPHINAGLTGQGIAWVFSHVHANNWHPLTSISHMLDCQCYGLWAGGHHLTSVLLHAATAVLLFLVLVRMTGDLWPSACAAALFAIHPLRVESVAWVAERKDVLSGLFFMLTLAAYVRYVRRPFSPANYLTVLAMFALGLLSKPMLVTVPFVLLLLDYWPLARFGASASAASASAEGNIAAGAAGRFRGARPLLIEKIPLLLLSMVSCAVTFFAQKRALGVGQRFPLPCRVENALVAYAAYVVQLFHPVKLVVFYPHAVEGLPLAQVAGAVLLLSAVSGLALAARRTRPYLLVGWLWYLGMLVPVIGLVQVGRQAMADRYTYLPQIGLSLALIWEAARLCRERPERRPLFVAASVLIGLCLIVCAWRQTSYWKSDETLWAYTSACTTNNAVAHYGLGGVFSRSGRLDDALAEFRQALAIQPVYPDANVHCGLLLLKKGLTDEAIAEFQKALDIEPEHAHAHSNLGYVLALRGRSDEAMEHCRKALEVWPECTDAHHNLSVLLAEQGKWLESLAQSREALRYCPQSISFLNATARTLATCPDAQVRNGAESVTLAERAIALSPIEDPDLLDTLAAAYAEAGRFDEAVQTAARALKLASAEKQNALADAVRERLKLYRARKPFRISRKGLDKAGEH
jgi:tetratricopeptide (TPR) repeat protein